MNRILIFNVNWLGDCLFSTAVIRNIRENFPDSYISCIIPSRCLPVLEGNLRLNEIIVFDEKTTHKSLMAKVRFARMLKKKRFDTVYLLHRSFSRAFLCWFAGIPERIGYYTKKRGFLLTKKITPVSMDAMHRIDYYLNIIREAGLSVKFRIPELFITEADFKAAEDFLRKNGVGEKDFVAGINPGGNWGPKRWPKENFLALAERLVTEFKAKVIITGGKEDTVLAEEIKNNMRFPVVIACGNLSLKVFAALCKELDVFISADSGPLHIANAAGARKIIALFGPTSPAITGPRPDNMVDILQKDVGCKTPCYKVQCPDNRCMKAITVEDVIQKLK